MIKCLHSEDIIDKRGLESATFFVIMKYASWKTMMGAVL